MAEAHSAYTADEVIELIARVYGTLDRKKDEGARDVLAAVAAAVGEYGMVGNGQFLRTDVIVKRNRAMLARLAGVEEDDDGN